MSPKAKAPAKKVPAPAKAAKSAAKPAPKEASKKAAKGKAAAVTAAQPAAPTSPEGEEGADEDDMEGAAGASTPAVNPTEMSASFKNFRHHPDMENFYRFIYENDLRHEALAIIDQIMVEKKAKKDGKKSGSAKSEH